MDPRSRLIVPIVGGLGNQLFLIATGLATALRNQLDLHIPRYEVSDSCFESRPVYWTSMFPSLPELSRWGLRDGKPSLIELDPSKMTYERDRVSLEAHVVTESSPPAPLQLNAEKNSAGKDFVLRGFFQSSMYFSDLHDIILPQLTPPEVMIQGKEALQNLLKSNPSLDTASEEGEQPRTYILGIHLRRGDYLKLQETFVIQSLQEYYLPAIYHLYGSKLLTDPVFLSDLKIVVFSEDKTYGDLFCAMLRSMFTGRQIHSTRSIEEKNMSEALPSPRKGVTAILCEEDRDYVELTAMAHCNDLIIANSSFSWWGAYINQMLRKRVVAPSQWFVEKTTRTNSHLYEANWIIL